MDKNVQFKQIILATDGKSNVGIDPVVTAEEIHKKGITISTIGIIEGNELEQPIAEIENISTAGGGVSEVTDVINLSVTMELVTQRSIYKTIEHAVNKELKEILGTDLNHAHPETRKKITKVIDRFGEEAEVKCCILIDCSGSMAKKINIAKNSIINLLRVMKARKGKTEICVIGFPGKNGEHYSILCDFTQDLIELEMGLQKIKIGGTTPTASALQYASKVLLNEKNEFELENKGEFTENPILKDNIV